MIERLEEQLEFVELIDNEGKRAYDKTWLPIDLSLFALAVYADVQLYRLMCHIMDLY